LYCFCEFGGRVDFWVVVGVAFWIVCGGVGALVVLFGWLVL